MATKLSIALALALAATAVHAQEAPTAETLAQAQANKALAKLQADEAEERLRLMETQAKLRDFQPSSASTSNERYEGADVAPTVLGVFRGASGRYATLVYASGVRVDAHTKGQHLPGGFRVLSVEPGSVRLVDRNGQRVNLELSGSAPIAPAAAVPAAPAASTIPPFPGPAPVAPAAPQAKR